MSWRAGILFLLLILAPPALRAEQGFESGLGSWSLNGLWQRVSSPTCVSPHAGSACLYFGRATACDYNDGVVKDATVTSGPVSLTDPARALISFWMLYQVESDEPACFDELRLEMSYDGSNWALLQKLSTSSDPAGASPTTGFASGSGIAGLPQWLFRSVDLSAYLGLTLYLRFRFLSSGHQVNEALCGATDASFDGFLGYALDDINFGEDPEPVALVKSVSPPFGAPGAAFTYTLVATNKDTVARDLSVWDSLPAGAIFVAASAPGLLNGTEVDWSHSAVPAGAAVTMSLSVVSAGSEPLGQDWSNVAWAQSTAAGLSATSVAAVYKLRAPGLSLRKSVNVPETTNGDQITYTLIAENFSPVSQTGLVLQEAPPSGFLVRGSGPAMSNNATWDLPALLSGSAVSFNVWGPIFGNDGQSLVNDAFLLKAGGVLAQGSASVKVKKPIEPQVWLRGIYPNPAPAENDPFGSGMHIAYELNQSMPMNIDIFNVAGEKLRSLSVPGTRGIHDAVWDLKNDWGFDVASGVYAIRVWGDAKVRPYPEAMGFGAVLR